ncbi:hypothetical protein BHM03_00029520 [Ensete ventricosum]|nr:hypothetical protein BHM03_00029520 [Ensete ventricosum]
MVEEVCVGWGQGNSTILLDAAVVMPIGGSSLGVKGHCVDATRLEGTVSGREDRKLQRRKMTARDRCGRLGVAEESPQSIVEKSLLSIVAMQRLRRSRAMWLASDRATRKQGWEAALIATADQ